MPFTAAHAVAALPFRRTRLNTAALVVGCLSPDFEYFLRLVPRGSFGHTLPGALLLDLPLSLAVLWLFQQYVADALIATAPRLFPLRQNPMGKIFTSSIPTFFVMVLSILLGAATHIIWDAFTHPGFWPYRHLPLLKYNLQLPLDGFIEVFKLLQYVSTALGLCVLAVLWRRWVFTTSHRQTPAVRRPLLSMAALACAGAFIRAEYGTGFLHRFRGFNVFASETLVSFISLLWIMLTFYGVWLHRQLGRTKAH
ncbi:DUF4184 family protein [Terriglobus sp. 2YAB30_2]|uniref:DUF4184 family protein n=1 Tax=unclassified Terriglobus TaxID=2628988 RepID=UPI003F96755D